ncbi:NAD(P)-dependent oxidoreductase [Aliiroseovarius sp. PTFE2010]|uniref:precorrin-2 dehydrogenase/sirohydrochlorin ferrochelatase family protein n=1 Tax=Aliiroseovarius sp. PTFE2010 TaxID=3417190 RepID=UPI003CE81025
MKFFPMFLRMAGRHVIIVGGGEQAAQKARLMTKTEARLTLMAPALDDELTALVRRGRAHHHAGPITPDDLRGAALVLIGSGCPGHDGAIHALAREAGALVNVVDQPHLCEATTPSLVDRDPLVVAIGTEGAAPVLARQIKARLETLLEPSLGELVARAGTLRDAAAQRVPREKRRALWRWVFDGSPRAMLSAGDIQGAGDAISRAITAGGAPEASGGALSVLRAAESADLMTLRAMQRLQEADCIWIEPGLSLALLELARRDAERFDLGTAGGAENVSDIEGAVAKGRRAVILMRDPGGLVPDLAACATEVIPPSR